MKYVLKLLLLPEPYISSNHTGKAAGNIVLVPVQYSISTLYSSGHCANLAYTECTSGVVSLIIILTGLLHNHPIPND